MSAYTNHLGVSHLGGLQYRLLAPIVWRIGHITGPTYEVHAGFEFDVSVPSAFRWLFDPHRAEYRKAAALHDHMLVSGWSRITAGAEFHNALKADGVSAWSRAVMLAAVLIWRFE